MDKLAILRHLAQIPEATALDVAGAFSASLPAAGMALLRLARAGLATRALDLEEGIFYYAISPKGRARVHYFSRGAP